MVKSIILTNKCYKNLDSYIDRVQLQDNLSKSFDDRLFDLLLEEVRISEFRQILRYIQNYVHDLKYVPEFHNHLFLREHTLNSLTVYCFIHGYRNFNQGVFNLIEDAERRDEIKTVEEQNKQLEQELSKNHNNLHLVER